jgi:hypothetical protein
MCQTFGASRPSTIESVSMLRLAFDLVLRQDHGFTAGVLRLLGHELRVPDHIARGLTGAGGAQPHDPRRKASFHSRRLIPQTQRG